MRRPALLCTLNVPIPHNSPSLPLPVSQLRVATLFRSTVDDDGVNVVSPHTLQSLRVQPATLPPAAEE